MLKQIKPGRHYIIVNIDEPYAEAVYSVLKCGQIMKEQWPEGDITFKQWVEKTFGFSGGIIRIVNREGVVELDNIVNREGVVELDKLKQAIKGERKALKTEIEVYHNGIEECNKRLRDLYKKCPHTSTVFHADPSGNNDSYSECLICGGHI